MVDGQTILTRDLLSVYHEVLINEIALMRSNVIVEEGINTEEAIIYVTDLSHNPNTTRGLDYVLLAYSIINGLRRLEHGYNILSPTDPQGIDEECRSKIVRKLKELLGTEMEGTADDHIEMLLAKFTLKLLDYGLINIVLDDDSDAISPLLAHYRIKSAKDEVHEVANLRELCELKIYYKLTHFFKAFGIDVDKLIEGLKKVFEEVGIEVGLGGGGVREKDGKVKISELKFKTLHGILFSYIAHASALPLHPAVLEANVLPFLIEPLPFSSEERVKLSRQLEELVECVDSPASREALQVLSKAMEKVMGGRPFSDYQYEYLRDILRELASQKRLGKRGGLLVILTSPTGTGKTYIFLFHVLVKLLEARFSSSRTRPRALLLYPRKALARDQLDKILALVDVVNRELASKNNVKRIKVGILDHDSLRKREGLRPRELRGLKLNDRKLYHCFRGDKYEVFLAEPGGHEVETHEHEQKQVIDWIKDVHYMSLPEVFEDIDILVTNHSMLTKLLFENFVYPRNRSFIDFIRDVELLVLDEAHIYLDDEELEVIAPTLLKLFFLRSMSRDLSPKDLEELAKELGLDIIISSATLTDSSIIVKEGFKLDSKSIIGIFKAKLDCQETGMPGILKNFLEALFSRVIFNEFETRKAIIYHDYDAIISRNVAKDKGLWKGPLKVRIAMVAHPYPRKESWTSLAESMVAILHWINAIRARGLLSNVQALTFIDMKGTLKDIFRVFLRRQILEAQDHADRALLTGMYRKSPIDQRERLAAIDAIANYIDNSIKRGRIKTIADVMYRDKLLKYFHVLHPYITLQDLKIVISNRIGSYEDLLQSLTQKMKLSNKIVQMVDSLNSYANDALRVVEGGRKAYEGLLKRIEKYKAVTLFHHGDLRPEERSMIEACMTGDKEPIPLLVMATKTLEVGVDIKGLSLIVQYSSYPYSVELGQRFGRSGRSESSFLVSTLILILRNSGEDVRYVLDQEAVEYVYNLEIPRVRSVLEEKDVVVRSVTKLFLTKEKEVEWTAVKQKVEDFLKMLEEGLGPELRGALLDCLSDWLDEVFRLPARTTSQISIKKAGEDFEILPSIISYSYLRKIGKEGIMPEIKTIESDLKGIACWDGFTVNLTPLIAKMSTLHRELEKLLWDQIVDEEVRRRIKQAWERTHNVIYDLACYMINKLKEIIGIEEEAQSLVTLYIRPGVTSDIGKIQLVHFIYPLVKERGQDRRRMMLMGLERVEVNEAFEKIRPLHTGG